MSSVDNQRLNAPWLDTLCTDNRANFEVTAYLDFNKVRQMAHELQSLRASAPEVDPGEWVLVPRDPTKAMLDNVLVRIDDEGYVQNDTATEIYQAMLAAAPAQPSLVDGEAADTIAALRARLLAAESAK